MSDYRVEFEEAFRFQELIASMRLPDVNDEEASSVDDGYSNEEEGVWDARTASMALVNALTNCPDSLEERILLREEFSRRGLNEVIVVRLCLWLSNYALCNLGIDTSIYETARIFGHPT